MNLCSSFCALVYFKTKLLLARLHQRTAPMRNNRRRLTAPGALKLEPAVCQISFANVVNVTRGGSEGSETPSTKLSSCSLCTMLFKNRAYSLTCYKSFPVFCFVESASWSKGWPQLWNKAFLNQKTIRNSDNSNRPWLALFSGTVCSNHKNCITWIFLRYQSFQSWVQCCHLNDNRECCLLWNEHCVYAPRTYWSATITAQLKSRSDLPSPSRIVRGLRYSAADSTFCFISTQFNMVSIF